MVRKIVQVVLVIVILGLTYLVYESIMQPIRFQKDEKIRQDALVKRLKEIRESQIAYKSVNGKYASTFDSLFMFINNGKFALVKRIGNSEDSTAKIVRDTTYVNVKDSLFKNPAYSLDSMKTIPFSGGKTFNLYAKEIDKGRVKVSVFCVSALKKDFMKGLNTNYYKEMDSIFVGSLDNPTTDGNWE